MAFKDFSDQQQAVQLLQCSLERGRLAHAYMFTGHQLERLEVLARTLAKTLNCLSPKKSSAVAIDCCDRCLACRRIEQANHPDVHWVRPESKSRVITTDQMRELIRQIQLKPNEAEHKIAVIVATDRLRIEAANAFLKTLEEPPAGSVLILLTADPQRVLETISSRCLRLNFAGDGLEPVDPVETAWLANFSQMAAYEQKTLLGRYRLLDLLLQKLNSIKSNIEQRLAAQSPLQRYKEVDKNLSDKWESELAAAVEAEYRRQRLDLLSLLESWLRDIWLQTLPMGDKVQKPQTGSEPPHREPVQASRTNGLLSFPQMAGVEQVAQRISTRQAKENIEFLEELQGRLNTNVQEALALEVALLKLSL